MILEIDVGNTRLKWRVLAADFDCLERGDSAGELAFLAELYDRFPAVKRARIACVARESVVDELDEAISALWGVPVWVAATKMTHAGLQVAYKDPTRLGVDRWLAMLAGYKKAEGAVCVVDCGSAITVDWVDSVGRHQGGYIVPGIEMQEKMLLKATGQIRLEQPVRESDLSWGCNTEEAVSFGVLRQVASFIDGIVTELSVSGDALTFFIAGGDAEALLSVMTASKKFECCPELVMDGLGVADDLSVL